MKRLQLTTEPTFPLTIRRGPEYRRKWIDDGIQMFKVLFGASGVAICKMKSIPVEDGGKLTIDAEMVTLGAEVWGRRATDGKDALCRFWFKVGDHPYESSQLQGWKAIDSPVFYAGNARGSDAAIAKMMDIAEKMK